MSRLLVSEDAMRLYSLKIDGLLSDDGEAPFSFHWVFVSQKERVAPIVVFFLALAVNALRAYAYLRHANDLSSMFFA